MFAALAKNIFGSSNDRYVRGMGKTVDAVNAFEPAMSAMSDDELRGQTARFRERDGRKCQERRANEGTCEDRFIHKLTQDKKIAATAHMA